MLAEVLGSGATAASLSTRIALEAAIPGLGEVVGELALISSRDMTVRLARADGSPLPGVTVVAQPMWALADRGPLPDLVEAMAPLSAVTDADGVALLSLSDAGFDYRLSAVDDGCTMLDAELAVDGAVTPDAALYVGSKRFH